MVRLECSEPTRHARLDDGETYTKEMRILRKARQVAAQRSLERAVLNLSNKVKKLDGELNAWQTWYDGWRQQGGFSSVPVPTVIAARIRAEADAMAVHWGQSQVFQA